MRKCKQIEIKCPLNTFLYLLQLTSFQKGIAYYKSCINTEEINRRGPKPLHDLIKEYGSWTVTSDEWNEESWDMLKYLSLMRRKLAVGPLFTVFVGADQRNSSMNVVQVSQSHQLTLTRILFFFFFTEPILQLTLLTDAPREGTDRLADRPTDRSTYAPHLLLTWIVPDKEDQERNKLLFALRFPPDIPRKQTSHLYFNPTFSRLDSKETKIDKTKMVVFLKRWLFFHFSNGGFGNRYHRPALKWLVSLLMIVQSLCAVFLSCSPNMSLNVWRQVRTRAEGI